MSERWWCTTYVRAEMHPWSDPPLASRYDTCLSPAYGTNRAEVTLGRGAGLALALCLGCTPALGPEVQDRAWLVEQLTLDNARWMVNDRELLAFKYRKMSADIYDFMRGTAGLYVADASRPGTTRVGTHFLRVPAASQVLISGDPHPENLGTFWPDDGLSEPHASMAVDLQDLDGASHGPYLWDPAAALGVGTGGWNGPCTMSTCVEPAARALGEAYAERIASLVDGAPPLNTSPRGSHGRVFLDSCRGAGRRSQAKAH